MSVENQNAVTGESVVLERPQTGGVYASLFEKINLSPVSELSALDIWQDAQAMSDASADERLTVATNDTPEGRALNRRVEISLVPQANACQLPGNTLAPSQDDGVSKNEME